jgi:23S rRNA (cytidine1920-2'-O)/16S rRNA (cytidine1409-2'-O)-methyltransferase
VLEDAEVSIKERPRFVSRGGEKLAHALAVFGIDVSGVRALDVGASTGGFVDCLLQGGAAEVIALDVGRAQLDSRLRGDARVTVLERINARYLTKDLLPFEPDFLTMDVSFISIAKVLPAVVTCMMSGFRGVILVKPQFEAGRESVGKGGIVRDAAVHRNVQVGVEGHRRQRGVLLALGPR